MLKYCAWCKQYIGQIASANQDAALISHGICKECLQKEIKRYRDEKDNNENK